MKLAWEGDELKMYGEVNDIERPSLQSMHGNTLISMKHDYPKKLIDLERGDRILSWKDGEFNEDMVERIIIEGTFNTVVIRNGINKPLICSEKLKFAHYLKDSTIIQFKTISHMPSEARLIIECSSTCAIVNNHKEKTEKSLVTCAYEKHQSILSELYVLETKKGHSFIANGYLVRQG